MITFSLHAHKLETEKRETDRTIGREGETINARAPSGVNSYKDTKPTWASILMISLTPTAHRGPTSKHNHMGGYGFKT